MTGARFEGRGFGQVEPPEIFLGGDPTGDVVHIAWASWGNSRASGTGTSLYVAPNQITADGTEESVTVVAFDLGTCGAKPAYQAVEWYYPQHGDAFDPSNYINACTGEIVRNG
jgi:hypothetical protein